jgi:hypothetical protein
MPRAAAEDLAALVGTPVEQLLTPPVSGSGNAAPTIESLNPILQEFVRAEVERVLGQFGGQVS